MKTNVKKGLLTSMILAYILALVIQSCRKEEKPGASKEVATLPSALSAISTSNPFDYLGELHNEALDNITAEVNFPSTTNEVKFNIIKQTNQVEFGQYSGIDEYADVSSFIDSLYSNDTYLRELPTKLYSSGLITSDTKILLDDILNLLFERTEEMSPNQFVSAVNSIESDIITTYGMPSNTILGELNMQIDADISKYLLITCAIAKSSYAYWYNASLDASNPWHTIVSENPNQSGKEKKFWEWLKRTGKDIGGFILGGFRANGGGTYDPNTGNVSGGGTVGFDIGAGIDAAEIASGN